MHWNDLKEQGYTTMLPRAENGYVVHGDGGLTVHANYVPESGMREINVKRGRNWTVIVLNGTDDIVGVGHGTTHNDARVGAHR